VEASEAQALPALWASRVLRNKHPDEPSCTQGHSLVAARGVVAAFAGASTSFVAVVDNRILAGSFGAYEERRAAAVAAAAAHI
jgi:hypothetical protein